MATAYGGYCATDDYRVKVEASATKKNETTYTIAASTYIQSKAGYASNYSSSWSVSVNGSSSSGSGTLSFSANQTKRLIQKSSDISLTHSTQKISVGGSVTSYAGNSSASTTLTIPAKTSYAVKYNANGGSGAPSQQTKWHGETLTLSSTKPTRNGYVFKGWATSSSGSVAYSAGASYSSNAALTLYAVWQASYVPPTIGKITAYRSDSGGTAQDEGVYAHITAAWSVDTAKTPGNKCSNLKIEYKLVTASTWTSLYSTNPNAASGTLNTTTKPSGNFLTNKAYNLRVTVTDSKGSVSKLAVLTQAFFPFDIRDGGHAVGIGHSADVANTMRIGMGVQLDNNNFSCQDLNLPESTQPPSDVWGNGLYFYGATNNAGSVGYIRGIHRSNGYRGVQIEAQRNANDSSSGTRTTNNLNLLISKNGTRMVELSAAPWLAALGIEVGTVGQSNTVNANSYKDITVTFTKTHSSSVVVIPVVYTTSTATTFNCDIYLRSVSATGFTVRIVNRENTDRSPGFHWIAIG